MLYKITYTIVLFYPAITKKTTLLLTANQKKNKVRAFSIPLLHLHAEENFRNKSELNNLQSTFFDFTQALVIYT